MSRKSKWITACAAVLALAALGYWWWTGRGRAKLAELQLKAAEFAQPGGPPRGAGMRELFQEVQQLPPTLQTEFRESMRQRGEQQMQDRLDKYFELPKAERAKELDRRIDEMQKARKQWEQRAAQNPPPQNPPAGSAAPPSDRGPGGPGGRRNLGDWLARSTPQFRAQMSEFRRDMAARMQQRGIPQPPFPGRGR